jgi:hypothetical protein
MRTMERMPGELNASIISSIINLICPTCGGSMAEFECQGKCGRNWLPEWEWAIHTTRRSAPNRHHNLSRSSRR